MVLVTISKLKKVNEKWQSRCNAGVQTLTALMTEQIRILVDAEGHIGDDEGLANVRYGERENKKQRRKCFRFHLQINSKQQTTYRHEFVGYVTVVRGENNCCTSDYTRT